MIDTENKTVINYNLFVGLATVMQACVDGRFVHMGGGYYWSNNNGVTMITDFHTGRTTPAKVNQPSAVVANERMYQGISTLISSPSNHMEFQDGFRSEEEVNRLLQGATVLFSNNGAYQVVYSRGYVHFVYNLGCAQCKNDYAERHGYRQVSSADCATSYSLLIANCREDLAKQFIAGFAS